MNLTRGLCHEEARHDLPTVGYEPAPRIPTGTASPRRFCVVFSSRLVSSRITSFGLVQNCSRGPAGVATRPYAHAHAPCALAFPRDRGPAFTFRPSNSNERRLLTYAIVGGEAMTDDMLKFRARPVNSESDA